MIELKKTEDGSHTLYIPELDEHYHSFHGAFQESKHIFIDCGFSFSRNNPVRIFEVGFGTGLNALLTANQAMLEKRHTEYTSIEKYPIGESLIASLNHSLYGGEHGKDFYKRIHEADWNSNARISEFFNLKKIEGDLINDIIEGQFDLVYFDAFGPDKQPPMWTEQIFQKISSITARGGIFVTYSSKGQVKRNLRASGFDVELLTGPPGKRQIIRAIKI